MVAHVDNTNRKIEIKGKLRLEELFKFDFTSDLISFLKELLTPTQMNRYARGNKVFPVNSERLIKAKSLNAHKRNN